MFKTLYLLTTFLEAYKIHIQLYKTVFLYLIIALYYLSLLTNTKTKTKTKQTKYIIVFCR